MRHAASKELFGYWDRLRNGRSAPRRDEVEPSDIRYLLSDTFILEVSPQLKTVSYRLAGTRTCTIFGRELKGYGFLGHWSENDSFDVSRLLAQVYRDLKPLMIVARGFTESGRNADFEMVLLPLEPMADGSARILGALTASRDHYWLGSEPIGDLKLRAANCPFDRTASMKYDPFAAAPLAPALEQEPETGMVDLTAVKRVAHLTVHNGGKA
ncbi:MAG: PAS domain-containing protein [Nitratireductor sp.]|nr:PAS domain-containing protein [Nitratireductor sp.]